MTAVCWTGTGFKHRCDTHGREHLSVRCCWPFDHLRLLIIQTFNLVGVDWSKIPIHMLIFIIINTQSIYWYFVWTVTFVCTGAASRRPDCSSSWCRAALILSTFMVKACLFKVTSLHQTLNTAFTAVKKYWRFLARFLNLLYRPALQRYSPLLQEQHWKASQIRITCSTSLVYQFFWCEMGPDGWLP